MSVPFFLACVERVASQTLPLEELLSVGEMLGADRPDLAKQIYLLWLHSNSDHPARFIPHFNVSVVLDRLGEYEAARTHLVECLAIKPDMAPASINLGGLLERMGDVPGALAVWRAGLAPLQLLNGDSIGYRTALLKQISRVLTDTHDYAPAETTLAMCLDVAPQERDVAEQYAAIRLSQCHWPAILGLPRAPRHSLVERMHPLSISAYTDDPLLQLAVSEAYVRHQTPLESRNTLSDRRHAAIPTGRKLRIGYVSSDMRYHAVGFLFTEIFELHDHEAFDIFAYSCGPVEDDPLTQRIKASVHAWRDLREMTDDQAAAQIAADEIDILIDVNGHTRSARLGVFARHPAPVQVNWLGFPGSMGSPYHHYIVADAAIIPPENERYYSETVLRLPCYQPNDRKRVVSDMTMDRAALGLPEDAFVFCSFNAAHKITRASFDRWMMMLAQTPNAVLWLLDYGQANVRLRDYAAANGIDPERLIFAQKLANPFHLKRIALADLVVDTAPYGAHTTASDALWMGVPVITVSGRCFASRVCGSLVRAAGLPELVLDTPEAFVAEAVKLATRDRDRLALYRARLQANRDECVLFNTPLLVAQMEDLFREMAERHRAGQTPRPRVSHLATYLKIGAQFEHEHTEIGFRPDYEALYKNALAALDALSPMPADGLLWTGAADQPSSDAPLGAESMGTASAA
jgi:predicted O-linked N-acetylglucosamine transferase (SPINDLY family)